MPQIGTHSCVSSSKLMPNPARRRLWGTGRTLRSIRPAG